MDQITFVVSPAAQGGFTARALDEAIFTQADSEDELREAVRDAVRCHFEDGEAPALIRLRWTRDELLAIAHSRDLVLTSVVEDDVSGFVSLCPELDICSQGDTEDEARANLAEALALFLADANQDEIERRLTRFTGAATGVPAPGRAS